MAELKIISMDEVQSKEVNWLWYPYIPYGERGIIEATKKNIDFSRVVAVNSVPL